MDTVGLDQLVRIAELEIDPEQMDAYRTLLAEEIKASVALEPGVIMLHAVAIREKPESIRILEVYADRAAYEAHLLTSHFLKYKTGTAGMVRSPEQFQQKCVAVLRPELRKNKEIEHFRVSRKSGNALSLLDVDPIAMEAKA